MNIDLENKNIWQQAAGDANRNYVGICLDWNVILNGPGYDLPWPKCRDKIINNLSSRKATDIRRFGEEMKPGDIVVLRMRTYQIFGVGIIVGGYEFKECFSDVDGWKLKHVRRVKWLWGDKNKPKEFDTHTLKLGDTTQSLDKNKSKEVVEWIKDLNIPKEKFNQEIAELPEQGEMIKREDISEYLFDRGVASQIINDLHDEIDELIRIANWYSRKSNPSETETVAYLTIPLLRTLGWTPQRMGIEWNKIDIALFNNLPRKNPNLSAVVEAKKKGRSCLTAWSQAQKYADEKNSNSCKRLVVTDGIRYGVYIKENNTFVNSPKAYLNLTQLRKNYPIYECEGAREALYIMSSYWNP